jgi:2'-5' RNA ligase
MSTIFQMPGYRIHEYRLVIPLPESLQERVQSLRKTLHEKHNTPLGFELKPSLTVLKCHAFERMEPRLTERFQEIAMGHNPFKVELKGFAAYPSHTLYIDVLTKSPFHELVKGLKKAKWLMNIPQHEPHFIAEPHLLVAQRLKPMQFIRMWMELEYSQFNGRFMADSMLLLRRSELNKRYEVVRRMDFMSLPLNVKQGELFS